MSAIEEGNYIIAQANPI
ncbi:hypothetical protein ACNKHV_25340 [Shigella flexneri]